MIVSSPGEDEGYLDVGGLYVLYMYSSGSVKTRTDVLATSPSHPFYNAGVTNVDYGRSITAFSGDLNGDGLLELVVSAVGGKELEDNLT